MKSFMMNHRALNSFSEGAAEKFVKNIRNALFVALASTGVLLAYYLVSGQAEEIYGLWVYAVAMFFGVLGYLLFASRKRKSKHHKQG